MRERLAEQRLLGHQRRRDAGGAGAQVETLALLSLDPAFALLLIDVGLPRMGGCELADEPRALRPGLPVVFVTGYAAQSAVRGDFLPEVIDTRFRRRAIDDLARRAHRLVVIALGS